MIGRNLRMIFDSIPIIEADSPNKSLIYVFFTLYRSIFQFKESGMLFFTK